MAEENKVVEQEEKKGFWAEFKEFIMQGDALDMAVGVVIGGAFTAIVTALVEGLINPIIGVIGKNDIDSLSITLLEANEKLGTNAVTLQYGTLLSAIINFLLVGFVLFCIIRAINKLRDNAAKLRASGDEDAADDVAPETSEELLAQIRDLMKESNELEAARAERIAKAKAAKAKAAKAE